jgi:hypothetical protein
MNPGAIHPDPQLLPMGEGRGAPMLEVRPEVTR